MNVLLFGATGMVGKGVLLECLRDTGVISIVAIGRTASGLSDPRLREIALADLTNFAGLESVFAAADACFYCLGVSSVGMSEPDYTRISYDYPLAAAEALGRAHSGATFIYVSGAGTDSSEQGRTMWARVKGRTENALLRLPLHSFLFRPGFIQPLDGIRSRTRLYSFIYALTAPITPLAARLAPNYILTTRQIGRAMLAVARNGAPTPVLEVRDIRHLAASSIS